MHNYKIYLKHITAITLLLFVIQFLGPYAFEAGAFKLDTSIKLRLQESGKTTIYVPPVGQLNANTHSSPLNLEFTLKNINLEELAGLVDNPAQASNYPELLTAEIIKNVVKYVIFLLLLSFCLGMCSVLFWRRQNVNKKEALSLGLVNVTVLAGLLLLTAFTYDTRTLSRAEYDGIIEAAPLVVGVMEDGQELLGNLGLQFGAVVNSVSQLQQQFDNKDLPAAAEKNTRKVLHVSDVHNNPAAFDLIARMVNIYDVDLIVDTGDLIDFGTSFEINFMNEVLKSITVPYVFIPGNHESPPALEQLRKVENVTVLEKGVIEKKGLRIAGIADPSAYQQTSVVADEKKLLKTARELKEIIKNERVDIIAAHNPRLFHYLRDDGNILLGGHIHRPSVILKDNYVEINAGSIGGSGIRGLKKMQMESALVLLEFVAAEDNTIWQVRTVELFKFDQFSHHFNYERFIIEK